MKRLLLPAAGGLLVVGGLTWALVGRDAPAPSTAKTTTATTAPAAPESAAPAVRRRPLPPITAEALAEKRRARARERALEAPADKTPASGAVAASTGKAPRAKAGQLASGSGPKRSKAEWEATRSKLKLTKAESPAQRATNHKRAFDNTRLRERLGQQGASRDRLRTGAPLRLSREGKLVEPGGASLESKAGPPGKGDLGRRLPPGALRTLPLRRAMKKPDAPAAAE